MEEIKVLRGQSALTIIEEMIDNDYVLTPDFRLIHLPKGHILINKSAACGPTCGQSFLPITYDIVFDPPKF